MVDQAQAIEPGVMQARPDLTAALAAFKQALQRQRRLPERLIELMRLRVAFRNQCRPCMSMRYAGALDDGLTEAMVCSLEHPDDAADMTAAERAAVSYADQFAVDHLSIAPKLAALRGIFDSQQIAEIAWWTAFFVGFGRLAATFDEGAPLPVGDRRADGTPLTPWRIQNPMVVP
jgi:AhpD family alkylhydroperoxidase